MQESTRSAPHGPPAAAAASSAGQAAPLAGKVAFITGAGRGIGRALALGFARAGARVCCAARTPGELDETARAIVAAGGQAIAVPADVTDPDAIERALDTCEARFGGIDVAVLNAGSPNLRKRAIDTSPEEWRRTVEVNLTGSFVTARALIPRLKRRGGGRMILVGSGTGRRAGPAASAYACAKAGVWMLTRVLAQELADSGILVNELVPGPVRTRMLGDYEAAMAAGVLAATRFDQVKEPEDIVPTALFMATLPDNGPSGQTFALTRREL